MFFEPDGLQRPFFAPSILDEFQPVDEYQLINKGDP
jgi:hypothetical protein